MAMIAEFAQAQSKKDREHRLEAYVNHGTIIAEKKKLIPVILTANYREFSQSRDSLLSPLLEEAGPGALICGADIAGGPDRWPHCHALLWLPRGALTRLRRIISKLNRGAPLGRKPYRIDLVDDDRGGLPGWIKYCTLYKNLGQRGSEVFACESIAKSVRDQETAGDWKKPSRTKASRGSAGRSDQNEFSVHMYDRDFASPKPPKATRKARAAHSPAEPATRRASGYGPQTGDQPPQGSQQTAESTAAAPIIPPAPVLPAGELEINAGADVVVLDAGDLLDPVLVPLGDWRGWRSGRVPLSIRLAISRLRRLWGTTSDQLAALAGVSQSHLEHCLSPSGRADPLNPEAVARLKLWAMTAHPLPRATRPPHRRKPETAMLQDLSHPYLL